jgi:peptide-methionine (S)-S-oxide reductase
MDKKQMTFETATLGGGCFWCLEAVYQQVRGVHSVVSGYAGGHDTNPNYEAVCSENTGHAEVVQIQFDPAIVSYREILTIFFVIHDPTTLNYQGHDVGARYRSVIFTHSDAQMASAQAMAAELSDEKIFPRPIVTIIAPAPIFYPAEDYHQNYFVQHPGQGYCMAVVAPKLAKFRATLKSLINPAFN